MLAVGTEDFTVQEQTLQDECASSPASASQGGTSRCLLAEFHNISSGFLQSYGHDVPVCLASSVSHGADGLAWVELVAPGFSS